MLPRIVAMRDYARLCAVMRGHALVCAVMRGLCADRRCYAHAELRSAAVPRAHVELLLLLLCISVLGIL